MFDLSTTTPTAMVSKIATTNLGKRSSDFSNESDNKVVYKDT